MTVGFFAPLPPARTGVADYAAALLTELRRHCDVQLAPASCGAALYHLGNNALHAEIYRRALAEPGVVVLHDAMLQHFFLGQLDEAAYVEEFVYNYGEWNRTLARELWRGRAASGADARYFDYPMLRRIAERSRAVVVHNPAAAHMVTEHAPGARVVEIPHLFQMPELPSAGEALRFRQRLGVAADAFLFGVFGFLRESKRVAQILAALNGLPRTALLIAGDFVSSDLARAMTVETRRPGVFRLPYLEERDFWMAASAVDACINLRDPAAGETSGIAIRMMGIGKPVLLTDSPEWSRIPPDACLRIARGVAERASLRAHMLLLPSRSDLASSVGLRAARHIHECHGVALAAKLYWNLLCDSCS